MSLSCSSFVSDNEESSLNWSPSLMLSEEVLQTINGVIGSTDPLDDPDFNSVEYINTLFPTEQSLSNVDEVMNQLEDKICNINGVVRELLRDQISSDREGREVLSQAQHVISQLICQVLQIKNTAEQSEETVRDIIHDIKQLDYAKRNLTTAITTLNHLQIVIRGVETIIIFTEKRMYKEILGPLQGVVEVMKHLQLYSGVPKVNDLITKVNEVQEALTQQVVKDFQEIINKENINHLGLNSGRNLAEICSVISIVDSKVKNDLLEWFIERQLGEYFVLFNENEENSWLDKVDHRYTWFKKHLIQFENRFSSMFPPDWKVSERITVKFCLATKTELSKVMAKRVKEIDVKLLLFAFQKTSSFEQLLAVRYSKHTLLEQDVKVLLSNETKLKTICKSDNISKHKHNLFDGDQEVEVVKKLEFAEKEPSVFHNIIGEAFVPYLYIFIDNLDKYLFEMIEKFVTDTKRDFSNTRNQGILCSCADLFVLYKRFLVQCCQLSNGPPMLSLSATFGKYLREYASKILQNNLPKIGGSPLTSSMSNITRDFSSASTLLQNFLKDSEETRFSKADIAKICCILTTAEYCLETTKQLEEKLKKKVDPFLADKVNLSNEQNVFASIICNCIQLLVSDSEYPCQTALSAMTKIQWQSLESAGDQSDYVTTIISHLKMSIPFIKENLSSSRKYFTHFCLNFVKSLIPKFIHSLYKCKPLGIVGAEQLLLDTQTLRTFLLGLPTMGSAVARKAPDCYSQVVIRSMSRGEKILKLVMAPIRPEAAFVDQFISLLPNTNIQEFQKILDMKSLRATDKSNLLTVFCIRHCETTIGIKTETGVGRLSSE